MIPDFPQEKEKLSQFWLKYLATKSREFLGVFGKLPIHVNREGHQWAFNRTDGPVDKTPYFEGQSKFSIDIDEVQSLTPDKIRQKLDLVAEEIARQMSKNMFNEIDRVTKEVGNEVDAHGQPLNQELFLQMLEKISMDFDDNGNWIPPSIIMHPNLWEAKKDEFKSWETDEEFLTKQKAIIKKKKVEWHDRENNRKLVD